MSNKVPQIRFNGYSDAWVQRKFGELIESYVEKTTINNQYPVLTSSQQGLMLQQEYFADNQVTSVDNVGYFVLPKGYATYRSRSDNGVFKFNVNHIIDKGVISYFYPVFYSKTQNIDFLTITLNETQKHQVSILAEGTGQKVLSLNKLKSLKPSVPSIEEQDTIVAFFTILDNLIAANQRKLDLLKEQKKGYLQKMFPKNGAKVPELRFAGFADDWEERKLSDIADRFDNLRVPITASDRKSGDTPYYGANGIQDYVEGFTHDGEFILVAEDGANDLKNYPVQYVNGKVWVNNHAHVLQGKKTITDNKFLMNSIKNFNIEPFLVGGGRAKLNADVMMKLNVLLPTFEEQEKIGSFFKQLDDTITLHQRKLDLLKEQKKGLLQKMFV